MLITYVSPRAMITSATATNTRPRTPPFTTKQTARTTTAGTKNRFQAKNGITWSRNELLRLRLIQRNTAVSHDCSHDMRALSVRAALEQGKSCNSHATVLKFPRV